MRTWKEIRYSEEVKRLEWGKSGDFITVEFLSVTLKLSKACSVHMIGF